jgi:hypothetical protein
MFGGQGLKYQCFPAIAGNITDWQSACELVDRWIHYYSKKRSHGGFVNKGLPPVAVWQLYQQTQGDHLQKLVRMGLVKLDNEWSVRPMGSSYPCREDDTIGSLVSSDGPDDRPEVHELPFALVMERARKGTFNPDLREPPDPGAKAISRPAPT